MESLFWLAYEQGRYDFILSIIKIATDIEYPHSAPVTNPRSASSTCALVLHPGSQQRLRTSSQTPQADDVAWQSASNQDKSNRACVHTTVLNSGHAKMSKTTTTCAREDSPEHASCKDAKTASWDSSDKSERNVEEVAADNHSAYGHAAAVVSSPATASAYSHATASALRFERQVREEKARRRQERVNRGQPLEVLQQTTTVPGTDLALYLQAYLPCCGTSRDDWVSRFEKLGRQFHVSWPILRIKMALSVAEPRQRTEAEAGEAFASFKLAWKLALRRQQGKQKTSLKRKWIGDVFGHHDLLMQYLKTGTLPDWSECQ